MRSCVVALAVACASGRVFYETARRPQSWRLSRDAEVDPERKVRLLMALRSAVSLDELEREVEAVATPGSARYRSYKTASEVAAMVAPASGGRAAAWASRAGRVEVVGDWVRVWTTVGEAEALLKTKLAWFERGSQRKLHAIAPYSIPDELDDAVEFVAGLHTFFVGGGVAGSSPGLETVTPSVLDSLYSLPAANESTAAAASQAVVQFGDNFIPSDLQTFFEKQRPALVGQTVSMKSGENNPDGAVEGEASLDTEYITAIGQFVPTYDYELSVESDPAGFLYWTYLVVNDTDPPLVHSISYGEYGGSYDNATAQRFTAELAKLALRGVSVLLASGDNGVGCSRRVVCSAGSVEQEFDFPSSPYLTMVGATQLEGDLETGATLSSGGFSEDYNLGTFQADQVQAYLDKLDAGTVTAPSETYERDGRAYPDLAAIGQDVSTVVDGKTELVSGTSCSAPIVAGIISLLNAELIAQGQQPLGWLNPWLYSHADMFNDITDGSNPYGCCDGFQAASGWDPVTGMGTPNYPMMLQYALADGDAALLRKDQPAAASR